MSSRRTLPPVAQILGIVLENRVLLKKLYVGNLSFNATEEQVRDLFAEYGTIESLAMITDRDSGRFRGFCFVEMETENADKAIAGLDGQDVDGRSLNVNVAKPRVERSSGGSRGGGRYPDSGGGRY